MKRSHSKRLTEWTYREIRKVIRTSVSGTFRTKDIARCTGYDRFLVKTALRRLQKRGEIIPYHKASRDMLYIKKKDMRKMQERRFSILTTMVSKQLGNLEFTPAIVARSLDITFDEAQRWFNQAIAKGLLTQSREGSNWASLKKENIIARQSI